MKSFSRYVLVARLAVGVLFLTVFAHAERVIPPQDIHYVGAFRVPQGDIGQSWWGYPAGNMVYMPNGNGGLGSLIGIGFINAGRVSEISIPQPKTGAVSTLNTATTLKPFTDMTGGNAPCGGLTSICLTDMDYMPKQGNQTTDKLYWVRALEYGYPDVPYTFGWSETDINNPNAKGVWRLTDSMTSTSNYLFTIPADWAATYVSGRRLAGGQNKINDGSSWGPTIYAMAPWDAGNPPASNSTIPSTKLLYYDGFTDHSHVVKDYSHGDMYRDAAWVQVGNKQAIIFSGTEALRGAGDITNKGPYPYEDYKDEGYPESSTYGCNGGGYDGYPYVGVLRFFDPNDLAAVAQGQKQPWQVQPYAVYHMEPFLYRTQGKCTDFNVLGGITYDPASQKIYVMERKGDGEYPIIHVFQLADSGTAALDTTAPSAPTNVTMSGATLSWNPATDNNNSSSNILYILLKNYSGQWRPVMGTTKTTWTDPTPANSLSLYQVKAYDALMNVSGQTSAQNPCDLNADGQANVSDVQQCVNQAIGTASCTTGDINKDGTCTVVDVQRVVNAAVGGQCVTQ